MKDSKSIYLKSYAKINLALDVTGLREDGYHTLETVMQRVDLFDKVDIEWNAGGADFVIDIMTNKPYIPRDERNIAYKAAMLMARQLKEMPRGKLKINIKKHIPVSAGLGGGSGNGAAVMIGLNRIWQMNFSLGTLSKLSVELGADVPFCLLSQASRKFHCSLCTGIGEKVEPLPKGIEKWFVLAKPPFGVSTREVFQAIDGCEVLERPDMEALIKGLAEKKDNIIFDNMVNVLENYTLEKYEKVALLKKQMAELTGVEKVLMSGSGPTIAGVFQCREDATRACRILRRKGYEAYWTS